MDNDKIAAMFKKIDETTKAVELAEVQSHRNILEDGRETEMVEGKVKEMKVEEDLATSFMNIMNGSW